MNENDKIFAHIGKKQIELEATKAAFDQNNIEYDRLLTLLNQVVTGVTPVHEVTVDLAARRWTHTPMAVPDAVPLAEQANPDEPAQVPE